MPKSELYSVHPVPGVFLPGYPTTVREGLTKAEAAELVATGAYQHDKPDDPAPAEEPASSEEN